MAFIRLASLRASAMIDSASTGETLGKRQAETQQSGGDMRKLDGKAAR
jgi:hypothetical protein